jgi:endonuclease/exonuclease/phosphatase family metal-dependent hydrolase
VATIERTDFVARADAIADEIDRTRPAVVGLQEVSTIGVDIPPLGVSLHVDFLPILLDALAADGLNYVVAIQYVNFTASPAPGISLTDAEAVLVDPSRVQVLSAAGHTFQANLGVVAPGVDLQRGWVTVEAVVGGTPYTFVSLHTEGTGPDELLLQLHALQVGEMAASLGTTSPAVVIGDFNAQPGSPAYQVMVDAGFTDVWGALRPGVAGLTCCHAADLSNHSSQLVERIDYVWTRGLGDARGPQSLQGQVDLFGNVPSDRIQNSAGEWVWPSDHAAVTASILFPRGRGI